jgi:hypothetical protein
LAAAGGVKVDRLLQVVHFTCAIRAPSMATMAWLRRI